MKDPMFDNLAERFAGHEMDVDPGTWNAISGKMALASGGSLSDLLQEKFAGHEAPVDPQVWTNISSQLGHGAAAGVGSTTGWWAAGIAATLVAGGFLFYNLTGDPASAELAEKVSTTAQAAPELQPTAAEPLSAIVPSNVEPVNAGPEAGESLTVQQTPKNSASANKKPESPTEESKTLDNALIEEPIQLDPQHPKPTLEGQVAVKTALQGIVDNYMTSFDVVNTEPKVPPPSQAEMPSKAVHPQNDEPEPDEQEVIEPVIVEAMEAPALAVLIPTAFSPNFDGVNDELAVSVQNYKEATVRIFSATTDRLVFSADNLEAKWNGQLMNTGDRCDPGMYFYALEVVDAQGRKWSKGEVVRLFR